MDRFTRVKMSDRDLALICRALECLAMFEDAVGDRRAVEDCSRLRLHMQGRLLDGAET